MHQHSLMYKLIHGTLYVSPCNPPGQIDHYQRVLSSIYKYASMNAFKIVTSFYTDLSAIRYLSVSFGDFHAI